MAFLAGHYREMNCMSGLSGQPVVSENQTQAVNRDLVFLSPSHSTLDASE